MKKLSTWRNTPIQIPMNKEENPEQSEGPQSIKNTPNLNQRKQKGKPSPQSYLFIMKQETTQSETKRKKYHTLGQTPPWVRSTTHKRGRYHFTMWNNGSLAIDIRV